MKTALEKSQKLSNGPVSVPMSNSRQKKSNSNRNTGFRSKEDKDEVQ